MADPTSSAKATILVVEDDLCALQFVTWQLRRLGYQVVEARSAEKALSILSAEDEGIDLLFTDVVLPDELNGIELARRARRAFGPSLKVLLTSGYLEDEIVGQYGPPDEGMPLLPKPYTGEKLAKVLEDVLEARA